MSDQDLPPVDPEAVEEKIKEAQKKSIAGLVFAGPQSANFEVMLNNVSAAQIMIAGEFLLEYSKHLLQRNWMKHEMEERAKKIEIPTARSMERVQ